jgi:site-specific recombinase XerD
LGHVIAWRDHLIARRRTVSTVKARISALSDLFKHLVKAQVVPQNPVRDIKNQKLKRPSRKTAALSVKQARKLLNAPPEDTLQGLRDRTILSVRFHVGPRRAEIAYLRVKDLHDDNGYLSLWLSRKGGTESGVAIHPEAAATPTVPSSGP